MLGDVAVSAVLNQRINGDLAPISFQSRLLSPDERRYSTYEKECLAVLFGCEKCREYLDHKEFELQCDNLALCWLLNKVKDVGRLGRWILRLAPYKFRVVHTKGIDNIVADTLSRMFGNAASGESEGFVALLQDLPLVYTSLDRLCGLVVSVEDYKHRGPGFDYRTLLRIFLRELGLERGPLSLVIG
jgi:hypothetical protein